MEIRIRAEQNGDEALIRKVNIEAFNQNAEADMVDLLRINCKDFISLVALHDEKIVGHILFTPAIIEFGEKSILGTGLAPMAVLTEYQNKGIGSKLIIAGLSEIKRLNISFVVVLGHPNYYPKFGFDAASKYGIICEYDGMPEEAFMILILDKIKMAGIKGIAKYRTEFAAAI